MKKIVSVLFIFVMAFLLIGCGNNNNKKEKLVEKKVDVTKTKQFEFGSLTFELPEVFERNKNSTDTMEYYDIKKDEKSVYDLQKCSLSINKIEMFGGKPEDYIKESFLPSFFDQDYKIENKTINEYEWFSSESGSVEKNKNGTPRYVKGYYVTDYNEVRYALEYMDYEPENKLCNELISLMTNSFKFKAATPDD